MNSQKLPSFIENPSVKFIEPSYYEDEHSEQIFLDSLQNKGQLVIIYLINGVKMVGFILGSDEFTVLFSTKSGGTQMLYKDAITTVSGYHEEK